MDKIEQAYQNILIGFYVFRKSLKGSSRGGKYYKREWKNGRWKYWYTREQWVKDKKEELGDKFNPDQKTGFIHAFTSFFGLKTKEQVKEKLTQDHKDFQSSSPIQVSYNEFLEISKSYWKNKLSIDSFFLGGGQKTVPPVSEPKETKPKSNEAKAEGDPSVSEPVKREKKAPTPLTPDQIQKKKEMAVFRYLVSIYGGKKAQPSPEPKQEASQAPEPAKSEENNFETMPEGESEKKSMEANPGLKMKALAQAGVKIWNNQRAYFNAKDFLDVEWDYSSKGRRRGATVEGETLSASQALSFQDSLRSAKIYYDANSDSINVDLGGLDKYITEDDVKQIVESRIDRTLKNYTPPEEKPSIQNSSTTIDQTEIDSHINTMASLQGGELKEYLDKLHYSIREQILTKESEKYKKPMTPTDETTNEYDREIVSKTRNRLMEELSKGVVAVDYTIKIHTGQDTIDEGSKRKAIFLDVIDGISKINDPKFYSQNHELTRAISSNSRSSNPALLAFSSAIKDKIKAQEKAESISKMEVKTSFDEGLEGKYNDGVLVESGQFKPEYYGGSKFYKIITPYNEAIIKKLQKYKQEVYNNHDYKARKANGVIEWVPTPTGGQKGFWRVPEAYTEYAKKILEDHLGK